MGLLLGSEFNEIILEQGDVLFKKGDPCKFSYILKVGKISCFSMSKDKRIVPILLTRDSGLIGEDCVFQADPTYRYNAVAMEKSNLIKIPNEDVMTYLNEAGGWMFKVLTDISARVSKTQEIVVEHKILDDRLNGGESFSAEDEKFLINALNNN